LDGEVSGSPGPERNEPGEDASERGLLHLRFVDPSVALARQSPSTPHDNGGIDHLQTWPRKRARST
jgi:hypothetical protein